MEFTSLWNKKYFSCISIVDNTLLLGRNDLAIAYGDEIVIFSVNMETHLGCKETVL